MTPESNTGPTDGMKRGQPGDHLSSTRNYQEAVYCVGKWQEGGGQDRDGKVWLGEAALVFGNVAFIFEVGKDD